MYKQWWNTMQFFVDHGIDNAFYWGCYVLAFTVTFVFNAKYAKKYNICPEVRMYDQLVCI